MYILSKLIVILITKNFSWLRRYTNSSVPLDEPEENGDGTMPGLIRHVPFCSARDKTHVSLAVSGSCTPSTGNPAAELTRFDIRERETSKQT